MKGVFIGSERRAVVCFWFLWDWPAIQTTVSRGRYPISLFLKNGTPKSILKMDDRRHRMGCPGATPAKSWANRFVHKKQYIPNMWGCSSTPMECTPKFWKKKQAIPAICFIRSVVVFFFPDGTLMLVVNWLISLLENQIKTIGFKYFLFSSLLEEMIQFD